MLKKSIIIIISTLFVAFGGAAQIVVTNTQNAEELVQTVLLGSGVTISNIKLNGVVQTSSSPTNAQVGAFTIGNSTFPFEAGLAISTGNVTAIPGPAANFISTDATGDYSDPDLVAISGGVVHDAIALEFDFEASGDSVSFSYNFGSEEYPVYVNSINDVFGFFISGPGLSGPYAGGAQNIAVLPGGVTPVSINTVNNGNSNTGPCMNCQYYTNNSTNPFGPSSVCFGGITTVLTAAAHLVCGETYHIKIAIADGGDGIYDSGVFLKGGSFSADAVDVQAQTSAGIPLDSVMIEEGCGSIDILFIRPVSFTDSAQVFHINSVGDLDTATDVASYMDSVYFPIGVDSVTFTVNPINDGITESMELLQIMVFSITTCGDTLYDSVRVYVVDQLSVDFTTTPATACNPDGSATALAVGNIGTPVYAWTGPGPNNTDTVHTAIYNNISSGWYYMTLSDDQCEIYDSVFVDQLNPPISDFSSNSLVQSTPGTFIFTNSSQNATSYFWDFGNTTTLAASDLSAQTAIYPTSGTYTIMLVAYLGLCTDTSYLDVQVLDLPTAEAPNVFTPNGDTDNDLFFIITANVANVDLLITNRWGNTIFESSGVSPVWDGKVDSKLADDGTYFYIYTATGINGDVLKGQGFIQLIRD